MSTIAMLAGGVLGVFLRNLVDGPFSVGRSTRWRSMAISALGGLVLDALTGAVISVAGSEDGPGAALAVGLSGTLSTYCFFSSAATDLIKRGPAGPP